MAHGGIKVANGGLKMAHDYFKVSNVGFKVAKGGLKLTRFIDCGLPQEPPIRHWIPVGHHYGMGVPLATTLNISI